MNLISLELDHDTIFCPITGEQISGDNINFNVQAKSFMGHWHTEIIDDPVITHPELKKAWNLFLNDFNSKNEDDILTSIELEEFLKSIELKNTVVIKKKMRSFACGPIYEETYLVLNLDV